MQYEDLREFLKSKREELKLSQATLADELGVSRALIGFWESGEKLPTIDGLMRWTTALQVPIEFAVGAYTTSSPSLAQAIAALARSWDRMSATEHHALTTVLTMVEKAYR